MIEHVVHGGPRSVGGDVHLALIVQHGAAHAGGAALVDIAHGVARPAAIGVFDRLSAGGVIGVRPVEVFLPHGKTIAQHVAGHGVEFALLVLVERRAAGRGEAVFGDVEHAGDVLRDEARVLGPARKFDGRVAHSRIAPVGGNQRIGVFGGDGIGTVHRQRPEAERVEQPALVLAQAEVGVHGIARVEKRVEFGIHRIQFGLWRARVDKLGPAVVQFRDPCIGLADAGREVGHGRVGHVQRPTAFHAGDDLHRSAEALGIGLVETDEFAPVAGRHVQLCHARERGAGLFEQRRIIPRLIDQRLAFLLIEA